ncbi:unnamed protein product, partial [Amoebophrya sp. A25]
RSAATSRSSRNTTNTTSAASRGRAKAQRGISKSTSMKALKGTKKDYLEHTHVLGDVQGARTTLQLHKLQKGGDRDPFLAGLGPNLYRPPR